MLCPLLSPEVYVLEKRLYGNYVLLAGWPGIAREKCPPRHSICEIPFLLPSLLSVHPSRLPCHPTPSKRVISPPHCPPPPPPPTLCFLFTLPVFPAIPLQTWYAYRQTDRHFCFIYIDLLSMNGGILIQCYCFLCLAVGVARLTQTRAESHRW